jgi:hypothetical protein
MEFDGARIFFPEERWRDFNRSVRAHWDANPAPQTELRESLAREA